MKKFILGLIRFLIFTSPKGLKIQLAIGVCFFFFFFKICSYLLCFSLYINNIFQACICTYILNRSIWWRLLTLWKNSTKRCHLKFSWEWIKLTCNLVFTMLVLCCYILFYFVEMNIIGFILLFRVLDNVIVVVGNHKI